MSWGFYPALYLALPAAALSVLLFWVAASGRRAARRRLADERLFGRLSRELSDRKRLARAALTVAALLLLMLSAARLRTGLASELARKEGIDLVVALDVSKSMLATDIKPSRFDRARAELLDLISRLDGDRVGVVIFSGGAFVQCPLTTDYAAPRTFLRAVHVGGLPTGGTAIASAIDAAAGLLSRGDNKSKVIMLLTDGENTVGDPLQSAGKAAELGIKIYAIGIGTEKGEPLPIADETGEVSDYQKTPDGKVFLSRLDEKTLLDIVRAADGEYRRAGAGGIGISELWDDVEKLERGLVETRIFTKYQENYAYFLLPALLLLILESFMSERRRPAAGK